MEGGDTINHEQFGGMGWLSLCVTGDDLQNLVLQTQEHILNWPKMLALKKLMKMYKHCFNLCSK
jgi:hypothetical protein